MSLEMKPSCERCQRALAADKEAYICSYECTYCPDCAAGLSGKCPNCQGELVARPQRYPRVVPRDGDMHYQALVEWSREGAVFRGQRYSRVHRWRFDGGAELRASSSPHVVKGSNSDPSAVDPEEGFLAAVSSCHMLWFLSVAADKGYVVDDYRDEPTGAMSAVSGGRQALTHVVLRPEVKFAPETPCAGAQLEALHHEAHSQCFLASALRYPLRIEPRG